LRRRPGSGGEPHAHTWRLLCGLCWSSTTSSPMMRCTSGGASCLRTSESRSVETLNFRPQISTSSARGSGAGAAGRALASFGRAKQDMLAKGCGVVPPFASLPATASTPSLSHKRSTLERERTPGPPPDRQKCCPQPLQISPVLPERDRPPPPPVECRTGPLTGCGLGSQRPQNSPPK